MASAIIFSSKGEILPIPRFFSIPFFWGKEDLRINHSSNDLESNLTALIKYYPAEMETQPGTSVISRLPTLCFLARLRSLLSSVATSTAFTNFSFTVHKCETWRQPISSFQRRPIATALSCLFLSSNPPFGKRISLLWCMPFACHWLAIWNCCSRTPRFLRSHAYPNPSPLISLYFQPLTS